MIVVSLDTDALAVEQHPAEACFKEAIRLGFRRLALGTTRETLRCDPVIPVLKKSRLAVDVVAGPRLPGLGNGPGPSAASLLASEEVTVRKQAQTILAASASLAGRLGRAVVVLDLSDLPQLAPQPGVDPDRRRAESLHRALDRVLPACHELLRAIPDAVLAVEIPAGPDRLASSRGDGRDCSRSSAIPRLGWWFNTARAWHLARTSGVSPERWLDGHTNRLAGLTLRDTSAEKDGLPLGSGEVDFSLVKSLGRTSLPGVLQMDPRFPAEALVQSRSFLEGLF